MARQGRKARSGRRHLIMRAMPNLSQMAFPEAMESFDSAGLTQPVAPIEAEALVEQMPDAAAVLQAQEPERILHEGAKFAESVKQNSNARVAQASTTHEIRTSLIRQSRIEEIEKPASNFLNAKTATQSLLAEVPRFPELGPANLSESLPAKLLEAIDTVAGKEQPDNPTELFADTGEDRSPAAWAAKLARFGSSGPASNQQEPQAETSLHSALRRPAFKQSAGRRLLGAIEKTPDSTERVSAKARRFLAPLAESTATIETASKFLSGGSDAEPAPIYRDGAEQNSDGASPIAEHRISAPPAKKIAPAVVRAAIGNTSITRPRFISAVAATSPMGGKPLTTATDLLSKSELPELTDFQSAVEPQLESSSAVGLADAVPQLQSADWPEVSVGWGVPSVAPVGAPNQQTEEVIDWGGLPAPWEALPDWAASTKGGEQEKGEAPSPDDWLKQAVADTAPNADLPELASEAENSLAEVVRASPAMIGLSEPVSGQAQMDLDDLAKQVYQRLKRRLAAERRRETY